MAKYYEPVKKQPSVTSETSLLLGKNGGSNSGSISSKGSLSSSHSQAQSIELDLLGKVKSLIVRESASKSLCDSSITYQVLDVRNQVLFRAVQHQNCCTCCYFRPYEDVFIFDRQDRPIVQIEKTEMCGYFSTTMRFTVSSPPGNPIGFVMKICSLLENAKFQFRDLDDQVLFTLEAHSDSDASLSHSAPTKRGVLYQTYHAHSLTGKVARIFEARDELQVTFDDEVDIHRRTGLLAFLIVMNMVRKENER